MGIRVLSLFDGISCGQIALERAGVDVNTYFSSEIDEQAIKITQKNYPNTIQLGDIKDITMDEHTDIGLLMGGSPCQSFSSFGDGTGMEGKSGLFWEFVRVLRNVKPKYFMLENVKMKKEWRDIITKELGVEPIEINSAEFSAQSRRRLYWTNIPQYLGVVNDVKFCEILEDLPYREIPKCFYKMWGDKQRINKGLNWVGNDKGNCLTTKNCHTNQYLLNYNRTKCRLLTPTEYEKLQTLPIGYTSGVSNTERYRGIGNGWTVDVIAHIFKALKSSQNLNKTNEVDEV